MENVWYNWRMNSIFIEGSIQTGKTTLIRSVLEDCQRKHNDFHVSGFQSQRILGEGGELAAFRIGLAMVTNPEIMMDRLPYNLADSKECVAGGIFKCMEPGNFVNNFEVFETLGVEYLREARNSKAHVILLDEIGGMELLFTKFMDELYKIIEGENPCIGVLKTEASVLRMGGDTSLPERNCKLREKIMSNGMILKVEPIEDYESCKQARKMLEKFVEDAYCRGEEMV